MGSLVGISAIMLSRSSSLHLGGGLLPLHLGHVLGEDSRAKMVIFYYRLDNCVTTSVFSFLFPALLLNVFSPHILLQVGVISASYYQVPNFVPSHAIIRFLEQERTIILAVVPANQDVATVDILERAKMVRLNLNFCTSRQKIESSGFAQFLVCGAEFFAGSGMPSFSFQ